jgi:acetoin:2,6-dichlorophenolindophenol oxidoreductase subunit beta
MPENGARELTFAQAIREALAEEMRRDSTVCIMGEDVAEAGTPFKVLSGLLEEFGKDRVLDTPISEAGFTGLAVGAAMTGMRPIVDIMFGDFITLTMDQMVNQAAKVHYMSGGKWKVPMVMRTTLGATRRSAAQHSQSLHAWFCHVPGLKVVLPSTPYDAKGLLKAAIRDDNPVVFFEDKMMYKLKGSVPEGDYTVPLGVADIKRSGEDISLVATSSMVQVALGAATLLEEVGISAEVVDPRTMWPLDEKTLIHSAKKTSRAIILDEGYERYGRPRQTHGRNACSYSLLSAVGRCDRADGADRVRSCPHTLRPLGTPKEILWLYPHTDRWQSIGRIASTSIACVANASRAPKISSRNPRWAPCSAST